MSEGLPENKYEEFQQEMNAGLELQKKDLEDSERGPIVRRVRALILAAYEGHKDSNSPYQELSSFQHAFIEHFGRIEAQRYRLYHVMISSTPPGNADLFDAEGEWSIAEAMRNLAEKYHIGYIDAKAA